MRKKSKIIILVFFIVLIIIGIVLYFNNKSLSTTNKSNIKYDDSKYNTDFSGYKVTEINLSNITDNILNITSKGVYKLTGTLKGYIKVNTDENVKLVLDNVTITNNSGPCIYVVSSKNTYIELTGKNTLTDGKTYTGFDDDVKGCIYSKDDLILFGDGTLNINANYQDGIVGKDDLVLKSGTYNITSSDDSIRGKDSLIILDGIYNINANGDGLKATNETDSNKGYILIKNGTFKIIANQDGIEAITNIEIDNGTFNIKTGNGSSTSKTTDSMKGIKADNNILIKKINITLDTQDDSIHSNNNVTIKDGTINISSGDDGIHADSTILISNGIININKSYEGIEANNIQIDNGNIVVNSSDDGININGGNDQSAQGARPGANSYSSDDSNLCLTINGGNIKVTAQGDGLDSNGSIVMTGGSVYVDGPTDDGNGPLDYNNTFNISGGTLIATGSSGMAQNISSSSTQYGVIIYLSSTQSANTKISIDGIEYTPSKSYSSIVISTPKFKNGDSYDLYLNGSKYTTFTISNIATQVGTNSSRMGGPGMR